jgi:hypothetical protein
VQTFSQEVTLKLSGLTAAQANADPNIATALRQAMASQLNIPLASVGTPTFTNAAVTTSTAFRRSLASSVSASMTVTTTGYSSSTATAQVLAALQSSTAQSNLVTYFNAAYGSSSGISISSVSVTDTTPTAAPTSPPVVSTEKIAGVSIAALVLVCIFIVGGVVYVAYTTIVKGGDKNAATDIPVAYTPAPSSDSQIEMTQVSVPTN